MKATPGCQSIRVWLHLELIFLILESQTPILLLIAALIHNQAHPFPMERAGKYKTITVDDSWLCIKTAAGLEVIRVHYLRLCSQTVVSLISSFGICICTYLYCSFYSFIPTFMLFSIPLVWVVVIHDDWLISPTAGTLHTSATFSVCLFQQRDLLCGWNLALTSDLWVQRLSTVQWPQTTPGLL